MLEPITLQSEHPQFPVSYVCCIERRMGLFDQFEAHARSEGWDYHELSSTHAAPAVAPDQCAELLLKIAGEEGRSQAN